MQSLDERIGGALARWVAWVDERPGACSPPSARSRSRSAPTRRPTSGSTRAPTRLVAADLPFRVNERRFEETFRDPGKRSCSRSTARPPRPPGAPPTPSPRGSRERTDLFDLVDVVGGGEFFDRNALLYLCPEELESFADRLAAVQPFLAEVGRDASAVGIASLLAQAVEAGSAGTDVGLDLAGALDRVTRGVEAAVAGRPAPGSLGRRADRREPLRERPSPDRVGEPDRAFRRAPRRRGGRPRRARGDRGARLRPGQRKRRARPRHRAPRR